MISWTTHYNTRIAVGDCLEAMRELPDRSVDLVFTSPPYEDARSYGTGFDLAGDEWVEWCAVRFVECYRVCRGLVAFVVAGRTKDFRWTATPALLMASLHKRGVKLRTPPIYHRVGIPGSGGCDWLRNDYEFVVCASHGRLPWSDNTAMGHQPKFPAGGNPSHWSRDGRVNRPRPQREGDCRRVRTYSPPVKSNPGNVVKCHGGGGHMGDALAHNHPAPFPERLAEFFILSFCPPGGTVLDPFCGSGTTPAVAAKNGRLALACEINPEYAEIAKARISQWASGHALFAEAAQ